MITPIVTVIVPVYNTRNTLDRTLESVCAQTYTELEIIIIDDGSEIDTQEKCNEWIEKDNRIRCIHKKNEGLGLTRNCGIQEAKGKYILFIDSDDYIEDSMVKELMEVAEKTDADVVSSNFYFNTEPENCTLDEGLYTDNVKSYLLPRLFGREKSGVDDFLNVSACTKMYNVDFLKTNHLLFRSERELIWEDMAFNFDCLYFAKKVYICAHSYYHYCYNIQSLTHVYDGNKYNRILNMYEYLSKQMDERGIDCSAKKRLNCLVMGNIRMCFKQIVLFCKYKDAIREIKSICQNNTIHNIAISIDKTSLSKVQMLFNEAVIANNVYIVYSFAKIQNLKKRGIID